MPDFETGIMRYIVGRAVVENFFPVDYKDRPDISCTQCRFYRRSSGTCALNSAVCQYPEKYVGMDCPLHIVKEENNGREE